MRSSVSTIKICPVVMAEDRRGTRLLLIAHGPLQPSWRTGMCQERVAACQRTQMGAGPTCVTLPRGLPVNTAFPRRHLPPPPSRTYCLAAQIPIRDSQVREPPPNTGADGDQHPSSDNDQDQC